MQTLYEDLRYGIRLLRSSPGFTAVAVFTLALGIAANATVFSWVDRVLLHPFPGARAEGELALFETIKPSAPNGGTQVSYVDYRDYRSSLKTIAGMTAEREYVFSVGEAATAQAVWGEIVSGDYFSVLGVQPAAGRLFDIGEEDDKPGANPVVVISHRLWRNRFHGDPAIAGKTVRLNGRIMTITGVSDPAFYGTQPALQMDLWTPASMGHELGVIGRSTLTDRGVRSFYSVVRLRPGIPRAQAGAEAATMAASLARLHPKSNRNIGATVVPSWKSRQGAAELLVKPLRILMGAAVLVLIIACANVANLLLARSVGRRKEFGVRSALGAPRGRIVQQLLTETLLLAAGGAVVGLLLTYWLADTLPALVPNVGVSVNVGFRPSLRLLGFLAAISAAVVVVAGAVPALFSSRSGLSEVMKEGGRSGSSGRQSHGLRALLVVSEVALALVAISGAGLFLRSFQNALTSHPGFDSRNVILMRFFLPGAEDPDGRIQDFNLRLRERLLSMPGVEDVAYSDNAPLGSTAGPYFDVAPEGYIPPPGVQVAENDSMVSPGYFRLMRIPVLEGRDFTEMDDRKAPRVLIVNEAFARRYFNGANPVGRRVRFWGKTGTVVGLVKDHRYFDVSGTPRPHVYISFRQLSTGSTQQFFYVRVKGDPAPVLAALRKVVASVDGQPRAFHPMMLSEWTQVTLLPLKLAASFLGGLGIVSLLLAALGLYSVMAYAVSERTREIGIRMALGARPGDVLAQVLSRGMILTAAGLAAGVAGGLALARLAGGMLVNISPADPATFLAATGFLALVALVACCVPASRATRVDPVTALRAE